MKNLMKDSKAYYEDNDYYEIFSIAEDYENKVSEYLKRIVSDKIVFDAGCGTGKFLNKLEDNSKKYIGMDLSAKQLEKAKQKSNHNDSRFICGDLSKIPLEANSVDVIISSWVLGTILNEVDRDKVIKELKRILKSNGFIIVIENGENSEFECIRGRDKDSRTQDYNEWILRNEFVLDRTIDTYFKFDSFEIAKKCFNIIYGNEISSRLKSEKINHKINIYKFKK